MGNEKLVSKFSKMRDRRLKLRVTKQKFKDLFTAQRIFRLSIMFILVIILSLTLGRELLVAGQGSLHSFVLVHFSGYLFFFLLPVEALIPYYYSLGYPVGQLFGLALITAVAAQTIDYIIGRLAPKYITMNLIGEKRYLKIQNFCDLYGGRIVFCVNLFPLSSSVIAAISGVLHYNFWKWLLYSTLGLIVKYGVILFVLWKWF